MLGPHVEAERRRDSRHAADRRARHGPAKRLRAGGDDAASPGRRVRGHAPDATGDSRLSPARLLSAAARPCEIDDPYRYGRVSSDYDLYLFGEGKHTRIYDKLGAHLMTIGDADGRALRRVGAQRPARQRRRRLQRLGRPPCIRCGRSARAACGRSSSPASREGERYKFEMLTRVRRGAAQVRSVRLRVRAAAAERVDRRARRTTSGATASGWQSREPCGLAGSTGRWRSTKCTSDRGRACRRTATAT